MRKYVIISLSPSGVEGSSTRSRRAEVTRWWGVIVSLAAAPLLAGCPGSGTGGPPDAGPGCAEGFRAAANGAGCEPILPPAPCEPGTMPVIGQEACQPVGPAQCAPGFQRDPVTSWGCVEVAAASCTGATLPVLGQADCQPVGDCAAVFPPANATHFVDPLGPQDATHFLTITAALAAAPANSVIAVAPGTYVESLQPLRAVTVIGKCARDVILDSSGGNTSGIRLRTATVTFEGVTIRGMYTGAAVDTRGTLTLRRCVLEANRMLGVTVAGAGSTLHVEGSVIRDSVDTAAFYGRGVQVQQGGTATVDRSALSGNRSFGAFITDANSSLTISDSIVEGTLADSAGNMGPGVMTDKGGALTMARTLVRGNHLRGVHLSGGTSSVVDSVVRDTVPAADGTQGEGLIALSAATARVERSLSLSNTSTGFGADGQGTSLTVVDSVVRDTRYSLKDTSAVTGRLGASLTVSGSALVDNISGGLNVVGATATVSRVLVQGTRAGPTAFEPRGVNLESGVQGSFTDLSVVGNATLGVLVNTTPGPVSFLRLLVSVTLPNAAQERGWGVSVQAATVSFERSAIQDTSEVGLFVYGAGAVATLTSSAVLRVKPTSLAGIGVLGEDGTATHLVDSDVREHAMGVLFTGAAASFEGGAVSDNVVGFQAQGTSTLEEAAVVPDVLGATQVVVSSSTRVERNQTRVGSGTVPLPNPF